MRHRIVIAAVLACLGVQTHVARGASFQDLGDLPFSIRDVSDDGTVAVGNGFVAGNKAFKWEAGVVTEVPGLRPDRVATFAEGVSADGSVIAGRATNADNDIRAYRYESGVSTELAILPGKEIYIHEATAVSPDGSVVVGSGEYKIVMWDASGISVIMDEQGTASAVSNDGSIVVGTYKSGVSTSQGFRIKDDVLVDIAGSAANNRVYDMSADGSVVIGIDDGAGYRWDEGALTSMVSLVPGDAFSGGVSNAIAYASSSDGSMMAGAVWSSGDSYAALWDGATFHDLNDWLPSEYGIDLTGWTLTSAEGISADGMTIFGEGIGPGGSDTWRVVIPEPATILLLGFATAALRSRRRHG